MKYKRIQVRGWDLPGMSAAPIIEKLGKRVDELEAELAKVREYARRLERRLTKGEP